MSAVLTPVIPVVGELIAQTPGTITLGQGVVAYGPPPSCSEAARRFFDDPENHKYKAVQGIPPLVERFARKLDVENGVVVGPERAIVVTAGGNMAFLNAVLAITDPGDEIVLLAPYYFNHHMAITMAGCRPVVVPTDAAYQPILPGIAAAIGPRTRAVVTISPNNPTGAVYPAATLRAINQLCRERDVFHIHDQAYEYFDHSGLPALSPASLPGSAEHTISLFSLSKAYGFASWRIGAMVIPSALLLSVKKIQDTNLICPPVMSQLAACAALDAGRAYCAPFVAELARTREVFRRALGRVADLADVPDAPGAFYCFVRVRAAIDPMRLVERLVREHKVAVMPGSAFGIDDVCAVRLSFGALAPETAAAGVERFVTGLRAIVG